MEDRQLNQFMSLKSNGELRVDSNISESLDMLLCRCAKSDDLIEARHRIRKASRPKIRTSSSYLTEIFSVPRGVIKQWTRSLSLVSVPGLYSDLDLEQGKYEGGFKVWESTGDLIRFVTEDETLMRHLLDRGSKLKVLELGTGAALPSLALISRIIDDPMFQSEYRIHVQDYNWQVLASLTLMNFAVNLPSDYFKALINTKCLRFFYGDWKKFRRQSNYKYDLILMSEVIYNSDNFKSLHNLLARHLKRRGYVVIATKDTYFGLSGGLYPWLDYVESRKVFNPFHFIKITTTNIPRSIVIMKLLTNVE